MLSTCIFHMPSSVAAGAVLPYWSCLGAGNAYAVHISLPANRSSHGSVCRCVGWYHSHPHFAAHPSIIDIKNQVNQQHQYRWAILASLTQPQSPSWSCSLNTSYNRILGDRSAGRP